MRSALPSPRGTPRSRTWVSRASTERLGLFSLGTVRSPEENPLELRSKSQAILGIAVDLEGFEPSYFGLQNRCSSCSATGPLLRLHRAPAEGFEPPTFSLTGSCPTVLGHAGMGAVGRIQTPILEFEARDAVRCTTTAWYRVEESNLDRRRDTGFTDRPAPRARPGRWQLDRDSNPILEVEGLPSYPSTIEPGLRRRWGSNP